MPWCPTCDRFLSPSTVRADGSCPTCGRTVDAGRAQAPVQTAPPSTTAHREPEQDEKVPIPWHLKLLVAALVIYLGFRAWQGIELLL